LRFLDSYGNLPYRLGVKKIATFARLEARLPTQVYAMLKRAAELQGRTLSDFVITVATDAAQRAIEDAGILRLSMEDQNQLADAILQPPKPSAALRRAAERRKKLLTTA
jgi:uncharacterized protein (DUF1778 family)